MFAEPYRETCKCLDTQVDPNSVTAHIATLSYEQIICIYVCMHSLYISHVMARLDVLCVELCAGKIPIVGGEQNAFVSRPSWAITPSPTMAGESCFGQNKTHSHQE